MLRSSCLELCVAVFNILKYLGVVMNYHWAILLVVSFCQPESLERTQIAQPEITQILGFKGFIVNSSNDQSIVFLAI